MKNILKTMSVNFYPSSSGDKGHKQLNKEALLCSVGVGIITVIHMLLLQTGYAPPPPHHCPVLSEL